MAKQALSYLRVSGKGQVKGDGFPRQRKAIAAYAKRKGLALVGEYRDEGVSGTKGIAERDGLVELILRIASNGVKVVLVENADRLARDLVEGELILRELRRLGVRVIAAEGGVDLTAGDPTDPTGKLIRQVLNAISEFEKDTIVLKLRAARVRARKQTGRCEGAKPFGYFEGEPETLALMKRLRRKNPATGKVRSYAKVAAILNAEGRSSRSGRPWNPGSIHRILST